MVDYCSQTTMFSIKGKITVIFVVVGANRVSRHSARLPRRVESDICLFLS